MLFTLKYDAEYVGNFDLLKLTVDLLSFNHWTYKKNKTYFSIFIFNLEITHLYISQVLSRISSDRQYLILSLYYYIALINFFFNRYYYK